MTEKIITIPKISLAVYCGSRLGNNPAYAEAAIDVGHWIGERGGQLVYGGGKNGLMGTVANAALDAGAHVIGVIPQALMEREHANTRCSELFVVEDMHERKAMMAERANAFLAMAGGIGTFEEILEQWVWRQLGYHDKTLGFLNTLGYYDTFLQAMHHSMHEGFMDQGQIDLVKHGSTASDVLAQIYPHA
jgi:uncharacterized protein (TIGR00730 family)